MEAVETKSSSGYDRPPWLFKGSALYQLHLVKAEIARPFIPKEFRLVEAFGYTLGGFFLAHYDDSPVGMFDELVVIAGIVWNPPTSCAWAARVLVNSDEACAHGRKDVGLPSQVAGFSKRITAIPKKPRDRSKGFLDMIGNASATENQMDIQVSEIKDSAQFDFCTIRFPTSVPSSSSDNNWIGPAVKMSLPSFSGRTEYIPQLLKYSCRIECRLRPVEPAKVSGPILTRKKDGKETSHPHTFASSDSAAKGLAEKDACDRSISVLLSKPVFALKFNFLKMQVEAPTLVAHHSNNVVEGP